MRLVLARYCVLPWLALCSKSCDRSPTLSAEPGFNADSAALFQINSMQSSKHGRNRKGIDDGQYEDEENERVVPCHATEVRLLGVSPVAKESNLKTFSVFAWSAVGCLVALVLLGAFCTVLARNDDTSSDEKDSLDDGPEYKMVMNRFKMMTTKAGIMGEGSFCICRKGIDTQTGEEVAIKVYKVKAETWIEASEEERGEEVERCRVKFKRQIQVLKELRKALDKNKVPDSGLWSTTLESVKVSDVFIQLIDYSKDSSGQPGSDPVDGVFYVVTELAEHSMRDLLEQCHEEGKTLERNQIQHMTRSIITVIAALHAKGLVHLDIKPENIMEVGGMWKLIDVDGCMNIGSKHSIQDATISFTPCWCAPEWARFLIGDQEMIKITSGLDVWSVGVTVAELVSLDSVLKAKYVSYWQKAHSDGEADFLFMDWLSNCEVLPLPQQVEAFDSGFLKLLRERLLVFDASNRSNLAQCIDDPFFQDLPHLSKSPSIRDLKSSIQLKSRSKKKAKLRGWRSSFDVSAPPGICHGMIYKLNTDGDVKNIEQWLKRDMWVAKNGNFCYFSMKENKRLVYMNRARLMNANIKALAKEDQAARDFAFQVQVSGDKGEFESVCFAAEDEQMQQKWMQTLSDVASAEEWHEPHTVRANPNFVRDLRQFKLAVRNRRASITGQADPFLPSFKASLWKVRQDGDQKQADQWLQREMWVSKNGSLCYYSKKQEKNLIYYNHADLEHCTIREIPPNGAALANAFEVILKQVDGCDFEPGVFAADTPELKQQWMKELQKLSVVYIDDTAATDLSRTPRSTLDLSVV